MGFTEISDFKGKGSRKTNIKGGIALKGVIGQFPDLRRDWSEKGGRMFLKTGAHYEQSNQSQSNDKLL